MTDEAKFEPVYPGDLTELLRFAWAASRGKHPMHLRPSEVERCDEYLRAPAPRSTHQRVEHALYGSKSPEIEEVKLDGKVERYNHGLTLSAITEIYGPAALLKVMELSASPAFIARVKKQDEERAAHLKKEMN